MLGICKVKEKHLLGLCSFLLFYKENNHSTMLSGRNSQPKVFFWVKIAHINGFK